MVNSRRRRVVPAFLALLSAVTIAGGGPLDPPAGPVGPTAKPLAEVEPRTAINATNTPGSVDSTFTILHPGSYYLTGNITGESGKIGIKIASDGVTIDLNGFAMTGVPGSLDAIGHIVQSYTGVAVLSGSISGWTNGVRIAGSATRVDRVRVFNNTAIGIAITTGVVESCTASSNGQSGISVGNGSVVRSCTAYSNGTAGFNTTGAATINGCSAYLNLDGIVASQGCVVSGCTARDNTGDGIRVDGGTNVTDCNAYSNSDDGIVSIGPGAMIARCQSASNAGDGIEVPNGCVVTSNLSRVNGSGGDGAAIHATSGDNRIEGNTCNGSDRGIDVDASGNFIVRNTCAANTTNWNVVAGNACLVVAAATGGAILGNSGGAAPGTTDPSANFTY